MTEQSPAGITRRAAQGRATREQLIEVATVLFAERGYEETSIEAVLAAAGVSRGALYHHFGGKDALFEAVLAAVENGVTARLAAEIAGAPDAVSAVEFAALAWITGDKVKIGVLTDLSGAYEAASGAGWSRAPGWRPRNLAGRSMASRSKFSRVIVEKLKKPDLGAAIANRWFDMDDVARTIADLVNSSVAFAVLDIAKQKNKTLLLTSAGSADFTGKACAPDNVVHWVYDTYEIGNATGRTVNQLGKNWFLLSVDYIFGRLLEESVRAAVERNGGKVIGSLRHPLGTTDFSSYIMQAQASNADVVAILNGGDDTINAVKSAKEFGLFAKQKIMPNLNSLQSTKSVGLEIAQGLMYVSAWAPDLTPESKAFMAKFIERRKVAPGPFHVGTYSVVRSYLNAVEAANSTELQNSHRQDARREDQGCLHRQRLLAPRRAHGARRVLGPGQDPRGVNWGMGSREAGGDDCGDDAFRPLADGGCPALATR